MSVPKPDSPPRVLVVDDHFSMAEMLADGLGERGYHAVPIGSGLEAERRLSVEPFDALVTDLRMPDLDGMSLLSSSRKAAPDRPVIVMTAFSAIESAVEAIRRGAYHYLTKPFKVDELALFLGRALDDADLRREATALKRTLKDRFASSNIIGRSGAMREVCDLIDRVADAAAPVLISGETGTGKGLVARAIHAQGGRAGALFVTINCAALPEPLLESELFGHVKGAFTGATANRTGLFEEAHHGTLFLDEIGEMTPALQSKLLDVLERGVVRAVGSNKEREVDVRVLAATHRELRERVKAGAFREDLLYRLEVITIDIPPLRLRRDDVPELIEHFLARARVRHPRSPLTRIGQDALQRLLDHSWPGNVRELEHAVERLVVLAREAEASLADLPSSVSARKDGGTVFGGPVIPMREMMGRYATWAFEELGGQKLITADRLGIDIKTLRRWLNPNGAEDGPRRPE